MLSSIFTAITGMMSMSSGLFTTINGITAAITNEKLRLIQAKTDEEKIASEERISSLQAKRDVMVAESQTSRINAVMRFILALGPTVYLTKIYIYDKVFGALTAASTDPLDPNLWNVVMATVGFYFLYEGAVNTARIIKS